MTKRSALLVLLYTAMICSQDNNEVRMTVWVHGTLIAQEILAAKYSPFRSALYVPRGLHLAKQLPVNYKFRRLAYECDLRNHDLFNVDHAYVYGWNSSKIRSPHRKDEGEKLWHDLNDLVEQYRKTYKKISIRLIGISHGGNVALHALRHLEKPIPHVSFELILVGTPVQESTRSFVNNPMLDRVFSFYSDADALQVLDTQIFHSDAPKGCPVFSKRTFLDEDQVVQVLLKINGKSIGHYQYASLLKYIPDMVRLVDESLPAHASKKRAHVLLDFKPY